jgi:hypothetical protein
MAKSEPKTKPVEPKPHEDKGRPGKPGEQPNVPMPDCQPEPTVPKTEVEARREFLTHLGRAAVVAPAIALLVTASSQPAAAQYRGNRGNGNGDGNGRGRGNGKGNGDVNRHY